MSYSAGPGVRHSHAIGTRLDTPTYSLLPTGSTLYPTADLAIYCPVRVFERVVIRKLYISNGAAVSGNFDVGVYDANGVKLVSSGSTAQSGTTTEQVVDVTDTTIGPGIYYVAVTLDNTTGRLIADTRAAPVAASIGVLSEQLGTGAALPATATWAVAQTIAFVPGIGMLIETTVA